MALADREIDLSAGRPDGGFARVWADYVGCSPTAAERLWWHLEREISSTVLWSQINQEAIRLFSELPPNVRRYVVSNADGRAHAELVNHGLSRHVEGVLDSGAIGVAKPDRRIFEMAAVALGVPLGRCIYVGDTIGGAAEGEPQTVLYDRFDVFARCPSVRHRRIRLLTELASLFADVSWIRETFTGNVETV
jgi:putative hydrolase of the HAD superfamily